MNRVNTITGHLAPEYKTLETSPTVAGGTPTVGTISDDDVVICAAVHLCFHLKLQITAFQTDLCKNHAKFPICVVQITGSYRVDQVQERWIC